MWGYIMNLQGGNVGRFPNFWSTEPLFHRSSRNITIIEDALKLLMSHMHGIWYMGTMGGRQNK